MSENLADIIDDCEAGLREALSKRKKKMTPYMEGFEACMDGKEIGLNPHLGNPDKRHRWTMGYLDAQEKERGR